MKWVLFVDEVSRRNVPNVIARFCSSYFSSPPFQHGFGSSFMVSHTCECGVCASALQKELLSMTTAQARRRLRPRTHLHLPSLLTPQHPVNLGPDPGQDGPGLTTRLPRLFVRCCRCSLQCNNYLAAATLVHTEVTSEARRETRRSECNRVQESGKMSKETRETRETRHERQSREDATEENIGHPRENSNHVLKPALSFAATTTSAAASEAHAPAPEVFSLTEVAAPATDSDKRDAASEARCMA